MGKMFQRMCGEFPVVMIRGNVWEDRPWENVREMCGGVVQG